MAKDSKKAVTDFLAQFSTEESCQAYFERLRFPNGPVCPRCASSGAYKFLDGRYRCKECKKDFSLKTGTIFGESKIPLKKWFIAIYLLTSCRKGISSIELAGKVGVTQKTGWFMDHRIREAMKQGDGGLFGTIEVDESFVGGLEKNKHASKRLGGNKGRSTATKTAIMGALQRGMDGELSKIRAAVVDDTGRKALTDVIKAHVDKGSKIYSDMFASYDKVGTLYPHEAVDHSKGEYVRGDVHTNGIESFWATFKRGYHGTYHSMSRKHMARYVDEFTYRFNTRTEGFDQMFAGLVTRAATNGPLRYKKLIRTL